MLIAPHVITIVTYNYILHYYVTQCGTVCQQLLYQNYLIYMNIIIIMNSIVTVYGWGTDSFLASEAQLPYSIPLVYSKGPAAQLILTVIDTLKGTGI